MCLICQRILFLFIFLVQQATGAYLTYATGEVWPAIYSTRYCLNSGGRSPRVNTITFPGTFLNKPKIIAYIQEANMDSGTIDYYYSVTKIYETCNTNNKFLDAEITLTCPTQKQFMNRFILDSGILNFANVQSQTFIYNHNNAYATKGFVNIQSFGLKGALDFSFQIINITSTQVKVLFTRNTANLQSLVFQVVIGPDDAFDVTQKEVGPISGESDHFTLNKVDNSVFLIPNSGVVWSKTSAGFKIRFFLDTTAATTISYYFWEWVGSEIDKIKYQEVWFNTKNYKVYYPFVCIKMRVSKKRLYSFQPLKLYIVEQSKTYKSGDLFTWQLDPGVNQSNIIASLKCPGNLKIVGYVLKCIDCVQNIYDLSTSCYGGAIDYVEHRIRFNQTQFVYQQLFINVTDTTISITQLATYPNYTILSLQLVNK